MKCFRGASVYVEGRGIIKTDLSFDTYINDFCAEGEEISLPEGAVVVPGFIDQHIHGAGGADAMDASVDALSTIATTVAAEGTTAFLATTMTQSEENISRAMSAVKEYRERERDGARILGVHLEGPFIASKYKGAQRDEFIAPPSVEAFDKYNALSGGAIKIVTLAPEEAGADKLIAHLKSLGICASVGHTNAKYDDIEKALSLGACGVTHTYNAQSPLHHRDIGTVGAAMLLDGLYAELIADCVHISVPAMKLLYKVKPSDKLTLITDSLRAKGLPDGESELGGSVVYVKDGEARLADGTLAGSVLKMNIAVKNAVERVGVPFTQAVDLATKNPAKNLGIYDECGSIEVGKRADFAVLDKDFNVLMTLVGGKAVYKNLQL